MSNQRMKKRRYNSRLPLTESVILDLLRGLLNFVVSAVLLFIAVIRNFQADTT